MVFDLRIKAIADLAGIFLALFGLAIIWFADLGSITFAGLAITFVGAVVYGGLPSINRLEKSFLKIPVPVLLLGISSMIVLWKIQNPEDFALTLVKWSFGFFFVGSLLVTFLQGVLGIKLGG